MKKLLSIIILNHNTQELLQQCLESLPKREDYQVIVVDNASLDDSVKMVEENFPWVLLIRNKTNCGYTRGNNSARTQATGKYVLFLNSDTKVFPGTLEIMVAFMESNVEVGISTCLTVLPNGQLYYACHRGFPSPWNSLCYFSGLSKVFPKAKFLNGYTLNFKSLTSVHEIDSCSGTFLLIRKEILDQIGWFDEDYFSYGEDIEMCYQVKELGKKVMFVPTAKIIHYWGATTGLKSTSKDVAYRDDLNKKKWNDARYEAMKIFFDKHYRQRYPRPTRLLVSWGIDLMKILRKNQD